MIGLDDLTSSERSKIKKAPSPLELQTANGLVVADQVVPLFVEGLQVNLTAYILPSTPILISLGKLCKEHHFGYEWLPGATTSTLYKKGKKGVPPRRHALETVYNVPLITPAKKNVRGAADVPTPAETRTSETVLTGTKDDWENLPDDADHPETEDVPPPPSPVVETREGKRKRKNTPSAAHYLTHFPKDPNCEICNRVKTQRAQCRAKHNKKERADSSLPPPTHFADQLTSDHIVMRDTDRSRLDDKACMVTQDKFCHWLGAHPSPTRTSTTIRTALNDYLGPYNEPKHIYTDGSTEYEKAIREMKLEDYMRLCSDTSTPYRPETNGIAERVVRKVVEGTSCAIQQSGFHPEWWADAVKCFCFAWNVTSTTPVLDSSGVTRFYSPYRIRFSREFEGPLIPFGAKVSYKPQSINDKKRCAKFGSQMLDGIFLRYSQACGGDWNGDLLVADAESLATANHPKQIHLRRVKAKEVHAAKIAGGAFSFPLATNEWKQPPRLVARHIRAGKKDWLMQDALEKSDPELHEILVREREQEEKESEHFWEDLDEFPVPTPRDATIDHDPNLCQDYWTMNDSFLIRHHVTPRQNLYNPTKETCPLDPVSYTHLTLPTKA